MKWWILLTVAVMCPVVFGVTPEKWTHSTEADFAKGEFESTVVNSLGQLSLAQKVEVLVKADEAPPVVSAVAEFDGTVYLGSGGSNHVYAFREGKLKELARVPGTMVACLVATEEGVLAGTGGDEAGVYRLDAEGEVQPVWSDEQVKYVWDILPGSDGTLYAATGPQAKVFAIDSAGQGELIYQAPEDQAKNILCLARGPKATLYAGTDESGLVVQISPRSKTGRILLDADEKEISVLLPDADGGLYVATSDAAKAREEGAEAAEETKAGRAAEPQPQPETQPTTQPEPEPAPSDELIIAPEGEALPRWGEIPAQRADAPKGGATGTGRKEPATPTVARPSAEDETPSTLPFDADFEIQVDEDSEEMSPDVQPEMPEELVPDEAQEGMEEKIAQAMAQAAAERPSRPPMAARPSREGNAVYYVQADGLVRTVFRRPVMILAMLRTAQTLLLGTGNGGGIYSVGLDGDQIAKLVDTEARQITNLLQARDGRVLFATANKGSLGVVTSAYAEEGTYLSQVLDAKQIARWGSFRCLSHAPNGAGVTMATRSGNVSDPDEKTWSDWSKEWPVGEGFVPIGSPAGRFLQYRLTLNSKATASPSVENVELIYQVGNLSPEIAGVEVQPQGTERRKSDSGSNGPQPLRSVKIKASDPNKDKLSFTIEFRQADRDGWIRIAKDLTAPKYLWDTRTVGDGTYVLRITASDAPSNPPGSALEAVRLSDAVVVDNTAPLVAQLSAAADPDASDVVRISGRVKDATSRIVAIHYAVDSQEEWISVLPADGICDTDDERFATKVEDLEAGTHRVALRVTDLYGNAGYASVTVKVGQ